MTEGEDRDNVLAAADRLFNDRGVQAVGIDDIRDAAGVPLKRLYREFPSKAHLVRAVLQRRDADIRQAIITFVEARAAEPRFQILAVFDFLYEWFSQPDFRGCMFINTAGELGGTSDDVARIVRHHKLAVRGYLDQLVKAAGYPAVLADQLLILANGAMVTAAINGTPESARHARDAAEALLTAQREGP
ncbi:TetR family transcriptional regulator [Mycobacterium kansasii]|uniref:TetR/AcrR family transcriptional regulator n=1 Tax=Mycobacterium kansasii TaxID=1768 RepID=UPI000CDD8017|nr:TetR/AcrR family transcriptional regulator [Mycobacterium kansasii]POX96246.1 TetR family transcriptional regulator [Mycobacterium kansasii]POY20718.1 TetR family transcriptional regulator [Mycobacterium kansasii]POY29086.1 TetR family transcriptional regulator [Mycobacterium kansasii]